MSARGPIRPAPSPRTRSTAERAFYAALDSVPSPLAPLLTKHTGVMWAMVPSFAGTVIATTGEDNTVRLWDYATRRGIRFFKAPGPVSAMAISPDAALIATGGRDGSVALWTPTSPWRIAQLDAHTGAVLAAAFSPDGSLLATAGKDKTIRLWDPVNHEQTGQLEGYHMAFSHDGTQFATATRDGTIRFWDLATHQQTGQLARQAKEVRRLAFSPGGGRLATIDRSHVRLWDLSTHGHDHQIVSGPSYPAAYSPPCGAAFSPDGTLLVTGRTDGTVCRHALKRTTNAEN
ncbi:hypothetical protein GCM10023205_83750 [Yinghuangia aomiensis]|uniref:WD domain-containing protein, G-beta repeat-containing protein n=2 Tax=Yinghuangia aomiensis TaxID=676205 RepID=A0ABP9IHR8_9ACTN